MPLIIITVQGVEQLFTGLNPNKAQSPDEISPWLLKELYKKIAPILTIIFQRSQDTDILLKDWKHAISTPAFKEGQSQSQVIKDQYHSHA